MLTEIVTTVILMAMCFISIGLFYLMLLYTRNESYDPKEIDRRADEFIPRDTGANFTATSGFNEQKSEIPDDWGKDTDVVKCSDCGEYNRGEYRFCRECSSDLSNGSVVKRSK